MIRGADISHYQGTVNFDLLKTAVDFLIIKTSEGVGLLDSQFSRNQSEARRVGLCCGYYHYSHPELNNNPESEADYFLKTIGQLKDGEILCLDYEVTYAGGVDWCKKFLDRVYSVTKVKPLIYMDQSRMKQFDWTPIVNAGYGLWLAQYDYNPDGTPAATDWPFMALRQYSNNSIFAGISGGVDGDVFYGDQNTFKKYGYVTPTPPQTPSNPAIEVISDPKARIDLGTPNGVQELQAVRSMINDTQKRVISLELEKVLLEQNNEKLTVLGTKVHDIVYGKGWWWVKIYSLMVLIPK
jgi:GH25 family lysozyme M1 (1,4-beta-N-acetylmuramidase)